MYLYGVSSKIPFSFNEHYLLADLDTKNRACTEYSRTFLEKHGFADAVWKETCHGFHVYCFRRLKFEELLYFLLLVPNVDEKWVSIGANRGYWFLASYELFLPPKPILPKELTYMRLKIPRNTPWLVEKNTRPPSI